MADGKLSEEEYQSLSKQFIEAVKTQGIAYNGNLKELTTYFRESLNYILNHAVDLSDSRYIIILSKTHLELLKKQVTTIQRQRRNSGY